MGDVYGSNNMVNLTTVRYLRISANFFLPSPENNGVLSESGVLNADLDQKWIFSTTKDISTSSKKPTFGAKKQSVRGT